MRLISIGSTLLFRISTLSMSWSFCFNIYQRRSYRTLKAYRIYRVIHVVWRGGLTSIALTYISSHIETRSRLTSKSVMFPRNCFLNSFRKSVCFSASICVLSACVLVFICTPGCLNIDNLFIMSPAT